MPSCWALPNFVPHQEMSLLIDFDGALIRMPDGP